MRVGNAHSNLWMMAEVITQVRLHRCTHFAVAINIICENLLNFIKTILYVDNFAIYASGKHQSPIERRLQK